MHTKGKLHSLHCFSRNTDSFKLLIYSESQATTVHFEVQSTSPSPSVHLTTLHRVVTFFQEDWALKASDSQSTERKRKKSQHTQLIIHDAFKACAAALCRYGNWGAQLTYNGGIPHLAVTQCAERKKKSKKKKLAFAVTEEDHHGAEKYFRLVENMVALSCLTGNNACVQMCV